MRENYVQSGSLAADGRLYIEQDWFDRGIPGNICLADSVYIDTSYGFAGFHSLLPEAMTLGNGSGCYDRASFLVGLNGKIEAGDFNIFNGSVFICNHHISVGCHCMFAWGAVITDSWMDQTTTIEQKRKILEKVAGDPLRFLPFASGKNRVSIEDNVWVGFDAVILPGVTLGRGCIVGSKSVIANDVPPYALVAGNPAKIIRFLDSDDTEEAKKEALKNCLMTGSLTK